MVRLLTLAFGMVAAVVIAASPASAQVPPGSYLQSCGQVRFDGYMLSAVCEGMGGQRVPTRLAVGNCRGEIANINGHLVCSGGGRPPPPQYGGFRPPRPEYGGPPPYGGDYGGGLPGGSWRGSCGNPVMRGSMLIADCRRVDGRVQRARADVRSYRRFANANGQLVCE